ncbi:unnamed protein product [Adineta steineri]|uniref:F-box domain-containing protein n=1 Tax=Adineta steineri TaxID=433720 RepID=A0A815LVQ8_9BILA|nr:unnamed protein product [Adineta steineri]CAF4033019.1 unnamed protein product [Adineta steineri]CAF4142638.1 unnamed protein product [Adineta steineri]
MNLRSKRKYNEISQENKKRKAESTTASKNFLSLFENLPNEIIYEIFNYLDIYDIYYGFFNLTKRFDNLYNHLNPYLRINISTMSKTKFDNYHQKIIIPNRQRISTLRLSNPFTTAILFSPPKIISKFIQLESLNLDKIDSTYLKNVLKHLINLPQLSSLTIHVIDFIKNSNELYLQIFRLPKLKYCKLYFQIMAHLDVSLTTTNIVSPIEHFIYEPLFPMESFENLLSFLPQLRRLSIHKIHDLHHTQMNFSHLRLKSFTNISLKLYSMNFDRLEEIIKNYFYYIEVLHITTCDDPQFLNAKRWERLIISFMPNLCIFDMNHTGLADKYHDLINNFNSSFWIDKQWYFTHEHISKDNSQTGIFYSINPYRRKCYTLNWQKSEQTCLDIKEINFDSVKHVFIDVKQVLKNCSNYFTNADELTINSFENGSLISISTILNKILPLQQITKITIAHCIFPFEQFLQLLCVLPNLYEVKYYLSFFIGIDSKLITKKENFQHLSTQNNVKRLEILPEGCTIEQFQFILYLFPQLQYLHVGMGKQQIETFIPYLSPKPFPQTHPLFFLRIGQLRKKSIPHLNRLMKLNHLHDHYLIKIVYCDLYLWW